MASRHVLVYNQHFKGTSWMCAEEESGICSHRAQVGKEYHSCTHLAFCVTSIVTSATQSPITIQSPSTRHLLNRDCSSQGSDLLPLCSSVEICRRWEVLSSPTLLHVCVGVQVGRIFYLLPFAYWGSLVYKQLNLAIILRPSKGLKAVTLANSQTSCIIMGSKVAPAQNFKK